MEIEYQSHSARQTKKIGQILGQELRAIKNKEEAYVLGLKGDLGGGKTTFLQGLAKGLGIKEKILSPTFVILKKFKVQKSKFKNFYHIDCYRIQNSKEIQDLGFKKIIAHPQNIVAVEWAERIAKILPKDTISINFKFIGKEKRKIFLLCPKEND